MKNVYAKQRYTDHPSDLPKTGGKSENNQKDVIASATSVVQASKYTNSNKDNEPIRLLDPRRSQRAPPSNTCTEAQVMVFLLTCFVIFSLLVNSALFRLLVVRTCNH